MLSQSSIQVIGIALSKNILIISIKFNDQKVTLEVANDHPRDENVLVGCYLLRLCKPISYQPVTQVCR